MGFIRHTKLQCLKTLRRLQSNTITGLIILQFIEFLVNRNWGINTECILIQMLQGVLRWIMIRPASIGVEGLLSYFIFYDYSPSKINLAIDLKSKMLGPKSKKLSTKITKTEIKNINLEYFDKSATPHKTLSLKKFVLNTSKLTDF